MFFGDGGVSKGLINLRFDESTGGNLTEYDKKTLERLAGSLFCSYDLEVAAHELTHGVVQYTAILGSTVRKELRNLGKQIYEGRTTASEQQLETWKKVYLAL